MTKADANTEETATALAALTDTEHHVWVQTPQGGLYAYRTGLIPSAARRWADSWNQTAPDDVPPGAWFLVVKATTTYEEVR